MHSVGVHFAGWLSSCFTSCALLVRPPTTCCSRLPSPPEGQSGEPPSTSNERRKADAFLVPIWCQNGRPWFWPSASRYSSLTLKSAVTRLVFLTRRGLLRETPRYKLLFPWHRISQGFKSPQLS